MSDATQAQDAPQAPPAEAAPAEAAPMAQDAPVDEAPASGSADPPTEAPSAKRARVEDSSEPDHTELLGQLAASLDPEMADKLYSSYGHLMQQIISGRNTMETMKKEREVLENASERQKDMAKGTAQEVTRVLNDLYQMYGPPNSQMKPEDQHLVETSMIENPGFLNALQPIVVAASAIKQNAINSDLMKKQENLIKRQAEISVMQRQMNLHSNMGGHVEQPKAADLWKNSAPEQKSVPEPVAQAAPAVEVAASGRSAVTKGVVPEWLQQQIGCYASGFQQNRVFGSDFNSKIRTGTNQ